MKNTLIEIKNNLKEINSTVDEAKNEISDLEYKEPKKKQKTQLKLQGEKKIREL